MAARVVFPVEGPGVEVQGGMKVTDLINATKAANPDFSFPERQPA